jgi:TIGR03009 family protein
MKSLGLTLMAVLVGSATLTAQAPVPQPSPERLDQLLKAWEERMTGTETLFTKTSRTETHPLTKKTTTFVGEAAFQKPNMARIDLTHQDEVGKKDEEKTRMERIFCNGQYIYEYAPSEKKIIIHDMPKNNPTDDNMILSFLRGMKAEVAKSRFDISLAKEDQWYAYLMIMPKTDSDKAEFSAAQLTIWMKNPNPQGKANLVMMPVRLWYRQPNGKEVTYTFGDMEPNARLDKETFVPWQIPGYKVERAAAPAPSVPMSPITPKGSTVRNQNP